MSEFFGQLGEFSRRVLASWELPAVCGWQSERKPPPKGAVIHYTRGQDLRSTVRWFMEAVLKAKASAHVVVAPIKLDYLEQLATDLPLVQALPVTVIQCVPHTHSAWHATWANGLTYGIENVNAGHLSRQEDGGYRYGRRSEHAYQQWREPVELYGRIWEPYTRGQVEANIIVLRAVQEFYGTLLESWILGHEQVQGGSTAGSARRDKRDPGPLFPLAALRQALFSLPDMELAELPELAHFATDALYGRAWRDEVVCTGAGTDYPNTAWGVARDAFSRWLRNDIYDERSIAEVALSLLGYAAVVDLETSMWIFKRMAGVSGEPLSFTLGTRVALLRRLMDRGIFPKSAFKFI